MIDVTVMLGSADLHDAVALQEPAHRATRDAVRLDYPDCGPILVRDGRTVVVERDPGDATGPLVAALIGPAAGVLLHQRGLLVLHGSAVVIDGGAVVLLGDSGAGKSTLAAALVRTGAAFLSDDVIAVDLTNDGAVVRAGFPVQKIWPDSARILAVEPATLDRLDPAFEKRLLPVERFHATPAPLTHIYVLEPGSEAVVAPISPQEAFIELVRQSYVSALLPVGSGERHMRQSEQLLAAFTPVRLTRPDGPLDAVLKLIHHRRGTV